MVGAITILHEDDDVIAVLKPAGIATANVPAGEESLFASVRARLSRAREEPFLGVVSRLDKPVSGVVVFAKTRSAAASLAEQFRARSVRKVYFAIVEGRFPAPLGQWVVWHDRLDAPGRLSRKAPTRATVEPADEDAEGNNENTGLPAELRARVLKRAGEVSLVELHPMTGRRHQLRSQLAAHGCPIVGDRMYRARLPFSEGIALHARELVFEHPRTGDRRRVVADFPTAWRPRFSPLLAAIPPMER